MNGTFLKHFNSITDPRTERCKKHEIIDILLLAISAVLSGAKGWEDIEDFGACFGLNRSPISVLSDHRFRD